MKNIFFLVLTILSLSNTTAFWNLKKLRLLQKTGESGEAKDILKEIFSSDELQFVKENLAGDKDRFLKSMIRFHSLKRPLAPADDQGHATNCGPPSHNFTLTWEPANPKVTDSVELHLNVISAADVKSGTIDVMMYMEGTPIIQDKFDLCKKLIIIGKKCPIKKGEQISFSHFFSDITILPTANYRIVAKILDAKSAVFLCAELKFKIHY